MMKGTRLYIVRAHNNAVTLVRETDSVWLKRDIYKD